MATQVQKRLRILDDRGNLIELVSSFVVASGETASQTGADSGGNPSQRAVVWKGTVAGQEVDVLDRIDVYGGSIFEDLITDKTIAALSTLVSGMDLGARSAGHPAPKKTAPDGQALTAAGGS